MVDEYIKHNRNSWVFNGKTPTKTTIIHSTKPTVIIDKDDTQYSTHYLMLVEFEIITDRGIELASSLAFLDKDTNTVKNSFTLSNNKIDDAVNELYTVEDDFTLYRLNDWILVMNKTIYQLSK